MRKIVVLIAAIAVVLIASAQLEILPTWAKDLPKAFHYTFLGVETWQWAGLGFVLLVSLIAGLTVRSLARRGTEFRDRFAAQPITEPVRVAIARAAALIGGSCCALTLLPDLETRPGFERDLSLLLQALAIVGFTLLFCAWWDAICDSISARAAGIERVERLLVPIMRKFVRAFIVLGAVFTAIGLFGGTKAITSLLATLGVGGLVVALAAKDSVENVFGSLTILFDMPFALGDWVKIDKSEGIVEEINLRSTRIRTFEDTLITLPNANLIRASVENYGQRRFRRLKLSIRLNPGNTPVLVEAFCQGLRNWLANQQDVQQDKTIVSLDESTDASLGVLVQCFLEVGTFAEETQMRHGLLMEALRLRDVHGVALVGMPVVAPTA